MKISTALFPIDRKPKWTVKTIFAESSLSWGKPRMVTVAPNAVSLSQAKDDICADTPRLHRLQQLSELVRGLRVL